ncbi:MAG TPA: NAD(P)-binding domain-containing protein [bacterium]|nr:NAD(P)-binding domain-containing protein [bacterium]
MASWAATVKEGLAQVQSRGGQLIGPGDARRRIALGEAVEIVRDGLLWEASGRIVIPPARRAVLRVPLPDGEAGVTSISKCCVISELDVVGYRFLGSILGDDPVRYLHIASLSRRTLLATIDEHLTYLLRIAALAVVAAAHTVAAPRPTVGVVGAGRLARAVVEALIEAGRAGEVVVTSRHPASREQLVRALATAGFARAHAVDSVREVAGRADFLVTATNAMAPVLSPEWIKPGATVYGLGAGEELPPALFMRAERGSVRLVVSNWAECAERSDFRGLIADGRVSKADVDAELWEIVGGRVPARLRADDTVCLRAPGSVGLDVLLGAWICARHASETRAAVDRGGVGNA